MQPARITQRRFEELKLLLARPGRLHLQGDRDDWMFGPEIFQMSLKKAKEQLDLSLSVGWRSQRASRSAIAGLLLCRGPLILD